MCGEREVLSCVWGEGGVVIVSDSFICVFFFPRKGVRANQFQTLRHL